MRSGREAASSAKAGGPCIGKIVTPCVGIDASRGERPDHMKHNCMAWIC